MKFVQKILLAIGIVLAFSVVCEGSPMLYKGDKEFSEFDLILNSTAVLEYYLKIISESHDECRNIYLKKAVISNAAFVENVRRCMGVSENDIQIYFNQIGQDRIKAYKAIFNKGFNECLDKFPKKDDKLFGCAADVISHYLLSITGTLREVSESEKLCVRKEFEDNESRSDIARNERRQCEGDDKFKY